MSAQADITGWKARLALVVTVAMALVIASVGCGRDVNLGVNPSPDAAGEVATDAGVGG